jgi:hypothetical protein
MQSPYPLPLVVNGAAVDSTHKRIDEKGKVQKLILYRWYDKSLTCTHDQATMTPVRAALGVAWLQAVWWGICLAFMYRPPER